MSITVTAEVEVDISLSDLDEHDRPRLLGDHLKETYTGLIDELNTRCRLFGEPLHEVVNDIMRDHGHPPLRTH